MPKCSARGVCVYLLITTDDIIFVCLSLFWSLRMFFRFFTWALFGQYGLFHFWFRPFGLLRWSWNLLFKAWEGEAAVFDIVYSSLWKMLCKRCVCVCVCVGVFCAVDWGLFFLQSIGMYFYSSLAATENALQEVWSERVWGLRVYFLLLHSMRLQANAFSIAYIFWRPLRINYVILSGGTVGLHIGLHIGLCRLAGIASWLARDFILAGWRRFLAGWCLFGWLELWGVMCEVGDARCEVQQS